jgi:hypothetical protein
MLVMCAVLAVTTREHDEPVDFGGHDHDVDRVGDDRISGLQVVPAVRSGDMNKVNP